METKKYTEMAQDYFVLALFIFYTVIVVPSNG
jgi:hypothetical protein